MAFKSALSTDANSPRRSASGRPGPTTRLFSGKSDELAEENRRLKERVQQLEKQNRELKRSVFDLNMRLSSMWRPTGAPGPAVFDMDAAAHEPGMRASRPTNTTHRTTHGTTRLAFHAELAGHGGAVYAIQYSPDGKMLATASMDGTARLWNAERATELEVLSGHGSGVCDLGWSASSDRLVTASFDSSARVWDVSTGSETFVHPTAGLPLSVAVSATDPGIFWVATSSKKLHVVDTRRPDAASVLQTDAPVSAICMLPNGSVISGDSRGFIRVWDPRQGRCVDDDAAGGPAAPVAHIAGLSSKHGSDAGGRYLAVNSHDNVVRLYDRGGLSKQRSLLLYASAVGHTTRHLPIRCSLYRAESVMGGQPSFPHGFGDKTHPKQMLMAVGSSDGIVRIYDASKGDDVLPLAQELTGHKAATYGLHFHPQELALATCGQDGTAKIWTV